MLKKNVIASILLILTLVVGVLALAAVPDPNMKTFEEPPSDILILWLRFDKPCDLKTPWIQSTTCAPEGNQQCTVHRCK